MLVIIFQEIKKIKHKHSNNLFLEQNFDNPSKKGLITQFKLHGILIFLLQTTDLQYHGLRYIQLINVIIKQRMICTHAKGKKSLYTD